MLRDLMRLSTSSDAKLAVPLGYLQDDEPEIGPWCSCHHRARAPTGLRYLKGMRGSMWLTPWIVGGTSEIRFADIVLGAGGHVACTSTAGLKQKK